LSPDRPDIGFYVPDDWFDRFLAKGSVPLVVSISRDKPRPVSLRDVAGHKVEYEASPEEDDMLFTLEHLFPPTTPEAASPALPLDARKFAEVLDRLAEDRLPLRTVRGEPVSVKPVERALRSRLVVDLDKETGSLLLSVKVDVPAPADVPPDAPPPPPPRFLVFRDPSDWRRDRVYAFSGTSLWPLRDPIPSVYGAVYFQPVYRLPHRESIDFLRREVRGEGPTVGNLRSLRDILGPGGIENRVDEDAFSVRPGRPKFTLGVTGSPASLVLSLKAVYSGLPAAAPARARAPEDVSGEDASAQQPEPAAAQASAPIVVDVVSAKATDQFTIADPDDPFLFYARNVAAERRALDRLAKLGLAFASPPDAPPEEQVWTLPAIVGDDKVLDFFAATAPTLQRHYWRVVLDKSLHAWQRTFVRVGPRVVIANNPSANAFEFGYTLSNRSGSVTLTDDEYRSAGDHSFVSRNGRVILFDRDAIDDLNGILDEVTVGTRGRPRKNKKDGPGAMRRVLSVHAHFIKKTLDSLADSGVAIESAPESWLHEADTEQILSELKPAPLVEPIKSLLRPYQTTGVAWLRYLEARGQFGILADEMGLGKTIQTLAWLSLPRVRGEKAPALVVCPTSLVFNWIHEARHFVPHLKTVAMSGGERHAAFASLSEADVVVTSYALMRRDIEEYRKIRFSAVVLDEAQNIKNRNTQNAKSVKRLNHDAARLVVTGTPIENSVADMWSIMDFLMPGYLGHYESFKRNYEEPLLLPKENEAHVEAAERLHDKIEPYLLRRLKKDVATELPPKIVKTSWCELSPAQRRVYNRILERSRREVTGSVKAVGFEKSRMIILTVLLRLRQVCCHLGLVDETGESDALPSGKLDHLNEILEEAMSEGHRVLVFSQFVKMLHLLRRELTEKNIPFCYLDGASKDRMEQVDKFNRNSSIPVFLISLKAGGAGLNLTGADEVVHFDPWWNPSVEDQATDRAHRIGQKSTVYALRLITANTIEERVLQMQRRKRAIIDQVVGGDEATMAKLTWADVQKLLDIE
ncbi:MAG: DEAD/DEAH box helicase, partial [Kiritimatiellae bacterium]|nr:DEAD/DEAH box helicase [Kiritimatiellia bacterium]